MNGMNLFMKINTISFAFLLCDPCCLVLLHNENENNAVNDIVLIRYSLFCCIHRIVIYLHKRETITEISTRGIIFALLSSSD